MGSADDSGARARRSSGSGSRRADPRSITMQNGVGRFRKKRALRRAATWTSRSSFGERVPPGESESSAVLAGAQALPSTHNPIRPLGRRTNPLTDYAGSSGGSLLSTPRDPSLRVSPGRSALKPAGTPSEFLNRRLRVGGAYPTSRPALNEVTSGHSTLG